MRVISWNINSVRARLDSVDRLLDEARPDVLCLQETKVTDELFPAKWFADRGYGSQHLHGQKAYHGVAILARVPLAEPERIDWCEKGDARHASVRLPNDVVLHNFYVPAGGDVPDPEQNDKFAHKLRFLDEMAEWSARPRGPSILVGDLNVAPHKEDVWSHKALLKVVSHTPVETDRLIDIQAAGNWLDAVRETTPRPEKLFSWWSYRARDWAASDRGRRLDHVWITPDLSPSLGEASVWKDPRGWEKPSDHAPLILDLK